MRRSMVWAVCLPFIALMSCGGPGRSTGRNLSERSKKVAARIDVQAFLYDAKFLLRGTRRSVRLEVFKDHDRVALAGRGYLGKTALKGWMTADSILVYFPGSNEYVYEATASLLASSTCLEKLVAVNLPALFSSLAPDVLKRPEFELTESDGSTGNKKKGRNSYIVTSGGCRWEMVLKYRTDSHGCRLKSIKYDSNSVGTPELEARLRTYKYGARVNKSRFEVDIPDDARRIIP